MKLHAAASRVHRLIALLLGIQILFWTLGGVVMSWIPIEQVRGEHLIKRDASAPLPPTIKLENRANLMALTGWRIGDSTYLLADYSDIGKILIATETGDPVSITESIIRDAAQDALMVDAPIADVELLTGPAPIDYRGPMPVWRANVPAAEGLLIYLSPASAEILAARTDYWRLYDFFWMLHIMDYETRDNFNNPLVMIFSASAVLFTLTGLTLLFFRLGPDIKRIRRRLFN